jgi:hypothetical protein
MTGARCNIDSGSIMLQAESVAGSNSDGIIEFFFHFI